MSCFVDITGRPAFSERKRGVGVGTAVVLGEKGGMGGLGRGDEGEAERLWSVEMYCIREEERRKSQGGHIDSVHFLKF